MPDRDQLFWLFFRFSGRVSRAAYFLAGMLLAIIQAFLLYRFTLVPQGSTEGQLWAMAFWAAMTAPRAESTTVTVVQPNDVPVPRLLAPCAPAKCLFPGQKVTVIAPSAGLMVGF